MSEILGSIWWLLVALGVLITFHEFGHFWVARRLGVRVLRFSIGFGSPLFKRLGKDGVEYVVAALPLGGYVKMLDEREAPVPSHQRSEAFNLKPVWARIAIVLAGPVFNLVFAVLAFWLMFMAGIPEVRPVIGSVSGIAAEAGLESGDEIIAIGDREIRSWSHAILGLVTPALDREPVRIVVRDAAGSESEHRLELDRLNEAFSEEKTLESIGLTPWRPRIAAVVGAVTPDSPAARAGLFRGDRILSIAGAPVDDWSQVGERVQEYGREGEPLRLEVERDGARLEIDVRPERQREGLLESRLLLGVSNAEPDAAERAAWDRSFVLLRYGPVEGLPMAVAETWRLTEATFALLARMITGQASVKNLSGPITIAQFANASASRGLANFLFFLGAISLSLGILNLLPIPVLDGGHLVYYLIEWVKGSPVSDKAQMAGQYLGLIALACLMSLAFVNDILRLIG